MNELKTWSLDYNERIKEKPEDWKIYSRNNRYIYYFLNKVWKTSQIVKEYNISSIIDYGCGDANSDKKINIPIFRYDPFVEKYKERPKENADLVIVYNVLSIIEEQHIKNIIEDIFSLSNKVVIFCIPFTLDEKQKIFKSYLKEIYSVPFFKVENASIISKEEFLKLNNRKGKKITFSDHYLFVLCIKKE